LQCHTVGYGASDGYVSKQATPALAAVSCGSCHGRGDYHVKGRSGQAVPGRAAPLRSLDCVTCHDPENSPGFNRDSYWELIKHGVD
jgi:cytochrome c553